MKLLKFYPVDFTDWADIDSLTKRINEIAERWYAENIENAPVVYGSDKRPLDGWNEKQYESTTHVGRLVMIEPIKQKECEHKNFTQFIELVGPEGCGLDDMRKSREGIRCVECRKELRPKGGWETIDP